MSTTVSLPDGTSLEFPDGTDPAVIQQAVAQARQHVARAAAQPDFSDVTGGVSSAADDLLRKKRAQMAQARQLAAAQGLAGPAPAQGPLDRAVAVGDRLVSGAAEGFVSIPELAAKLLPDDSPSAMLPSQDTAREVPGDPYPTLGRPGGFFDLKAQREDITRQTDEARERLRASKGDPYVVAAVDTLAEAAGMAIPLGEGAGAAKAVERAQGPVRLFERAAPAVRAAAGTTPEEAYLARRAAALRAMPGATAAPLRPGAVVDAMQPERSILQVGAHADDLSQDVALGLRARPQDAADAAELAQQSLAISPDEPAPGMVRLYRGQGPLFPGVPAPKKLSFTLSPETAERYSFKGGGIHYLDLPEEEAARYQNLFGDIQNDPEVAFKSNLQEFEVPFDRAAEMKLLRERQAPPSLAEIFGDQGKSMQAGAALPPEAPPPPFRPPPRVAVTERGTRIGFDYEVRDASDLVTSHDEALRPNPRYPAELQPRDRARLASEAQVSRIEKNLNPDLLGESPQAGSGAPIIGPDGIVESGNARSIALKRAYRLGGERAGNYRSWLSENAPRFGIDPAAVEAVPHPVLVRVRNTAVDRAAFAVEANEAPQALMSATERAAVDANHITPEMLDSLRIGESGVNLGTNPDFVRAFAGKINPAELGSVFDAQGQLSAEGAKRLQNAILSKAYGDPEAIAQLAENADSNVRSVGAALMQQAPRYARMGQAMGQGALHPLDITPDIGPALKKLSALRAEGTKVPDYLAQGGLFGSELSPESRALLALFDANGRSSARVSGILGRYADLVEGLGHPRQGGLFGGAGEIPSRMDLLREAASSVENQPALFAMAERPPLTATVDAELAGRSVPTPRGDLIPSPQESGLQVARQPTESLGSQLGAVENVQSGAAPAAEPSTPPPTLRNLLTGEELPLDTPRTGTTHAITRAEQAAAGLPRTVPRPRVDAWEEARQVFEQDPQAARHLAQEVAAKPRPLSDFEEHLLQHDRAQLKPAYDDALAAEEQALASGDPAQAAAAKLHRLAVERDFQANADAADLGGSQWGKSGKARQVEIGEDYSPLQLVRRYKVANLGEDAPDAVRTKLVDVSRQLEAAQTRLAAAEERAQTLEAQRMIHSENQAAAREIRSKGRAAVTAGLDQEYAGLSAEWRKATGLAQAGVNPDQAAILAKMARNRVRAGVTNLQDLVDGIFQDARPHLDTLEPRDVRDAIAGASPKAQAAAKKAAVSEFTALRREARVLNALEDARAKLEAVPDSRARATLQKEVARWEAEAEKIAGGDRGGGGPLSDPERIRASLARNATRQAELRDQIASGTIISKTRAPVADYPLIQARAETERLRREADAIIGRRELQNRGWLQKGLDLTAATARFTPLTSVTGTLPKLAAAASWRSLVMRPAEQLLSVADPYLPLIRQLSAEAPVEGGGVGLSALKKSYQGFFSREARAEAMAHLRGEEGPLALALGKPHQPSGAPAFMDYPSHLHAALKSPAVVAGYNWAMESQAKALARAGQAITPELRTTMESNAWEVALRDILLNDNAAVQRFNLALQKLPQDSTATRVGIAAVRSQLPIVKVATNYPLQATDYLFGLPKFGIRAGKVIYRGTKATAGQEARTLADIVHAGIQASPPGYADQIMRNLKRGRLGAALAGLVLTGAVEVGGYYRKGEHRSESDLQPGEIRIGGSDAILQLPHNVLHSPPMEAMQVVGTFKRSKSFSQGLGTSALGLAEQTPFFEESVRLGRDLPNNPAKFAGMAARQISEPPDMQKLARVLDQEKERSTPQKVGQALGWAGLKVGPLEVPEIKARKRTPHGGFWEQLLEQEMLGVPGLRDNVR